MQRLQYLRANIPELPLSDDDGYDDGVMEIVQATEGRWVYVYVYACMICVCYYCVLVFIYVFKRYIYMYI